MLIFREKIIIEKLPKAYSFLLSYEDQDSSKLSLLCKNKKVYMSKKDIYYKCDICNKEFLGDVMKFKSLLTKKYSLDILLCGDNKISPECNKIKQQKINNYRTKINKSPAKGRVVSKKEKEKRLKTCKERKVFEKQSDNLKGKSFELLYGEEKANKMKKSLRQASLGTTYHQGFKNTEESKKKMSESRLKYMQTGAKEKKYTSPFTNEKVDYITFQKDIMTFNWLNKSEEDKINYRKNIISSFFEKQTTKKYSYGYHTSWFNIGTDQEEIKDEIFMSSYELIFFIKADKEKLFYKTNNIIYIPYTHPKDNQTHYYVPDVLVYEDITCNKLIKIIEIKPYDFVFNPKNRTSDYYEITKRKIEALYSFCIKNSLGCQIITEKDLGIPYGSSSYEREKFCKRILNDYYENKKNNNKKTQ